MFKIFNEQFEEIPLPIDDLGYGLRGLDLNISSVAQEVTEHNVQGLSGSIQTGFRDASRDMNISARIKAKDKTDFRLKRDRVFAFFKQLGSFYITENTQGNKLMLVRVVDSYQFDRIPNSQTYSIADIPLKIIGQPYWISRFKSTDLQKGINFDGNWSFGMGLDVEPNKLNYEFSSSSFTLYNAGSVPIKTIQEKNHCIITIEVKETVNNFLLRDAIGKRFEYNPNKQSNWTLNSGAKIILNGHYISLNETSILERTNRYFPVILSGDNIFNVEGISKFLITFDFRFKYY
ncbi:phage tail domain-containing protein [Cytobacillus sp. FSL R5-0569]|uniref:phage tail domain-containing protein n=1 Tax=Cytobacillus sp. FSL R5-0569 TaxID=2921649 RepID=UPI0030FA85F1